MNTSTLGDVGPHDDASYEGPGGVVSLDYAREKYREFQSTLNAVDMGYQAAQSALLNPALDPGIADELRDLISDYESRRWTLKATAEAMNAGAALINAAGGRMPQLSIPGTLGLLPALPLATVAALATAAVLIAWGRTWLQGVNERLKTAQLIAAQDSPAAAASLAREISQSDAALRQAESSGLGALVPLLKWGAIAAGAFMLWRALKDD